MILGREISSLNVIFLEFLDLRPPVNIKQLACSVSLSNWLLGSLPSFIDCHPYVSLIFFSSTYFFFLFFLPILSLFHVLLFLLLFSSSSPFSSFSFASPSPSSIFIFPSSRMNRALLNLPRPCLSL